MRRTGYRWWIERFRRTFELVRRGADRPLPRLRRLLGRARRARDARSQDAGAAGPGRELFDAVSAELGELPLVAEDLGVITPAVDRLRERLGLPGMAVMQFLLPWRPRPDRTSPRTRSSTPARTTTTPRAAGGSRRPTSRATTRSPPRATPGSRRCPHGGRAELAAHPAGARLEGRHGDRSRAGPARPRQQRPHEHAGPGGRQLELPPRAGRARRRARGTAARGDPREPAASLVLVRRGTTTAARLLAVAALSTAALAAPGGGARADERRRAAGRRRLVPPARRPTAARTASGSSTSAPPTASPARSTAPTSTPTTARSAPPPSTTGKHDASRTAAR